MNRVAEGIPGLERVGGASRSRLSREYRDVVDGTVALLERYEAQVGSAHDPIAGVVAALWREWRTLWSDAAECLAEIADVPEHLAAAKAYTELRLTPKLMCAPLWRQAYNKPQGYPGDYMVMEHIYAASARGDTHFARAAHMLGVHIGQFVVKRKDLVREAIVASIARHDGAGATRIVSLGAGPAREVFELARADIGAAHPVDFVLVDQDGDALKFAGSAISGALRERGCAQQFRVEPRQVSVLRLLREIDPTQLVAEAEMIYSAGLFDYFADRTCRVLTRRLYDALRPGGLLLLGNMKAGTDMVWPLELIADWSLNYRTAESILAWADGLEGAEISLRTEATGYDYILSVRRPA
jgi:extracellular factor (EF) 3-hydroxypalmitic acid methyl ester biosynthesis protein